MPLSDHEQRLLEQMERALYAEDPKFADSLRKTRRATVDRKRIALGVAGAVAGLAVLLAGVIGQAVLLGLIGFLMMLGGAVVAYTAFVAKPQAKTPAAPEPGGTPRAVKSPTVKPQRPAGRTSGGFMDRLEERWRKRRGDRGQF